VTISVVILLVASFFLQKEEEKKEERREGCLRLVIAHTPKDLPKIEVLSKKVTFVVAVVLK
jgi:hypothetical protein